MIVTPVLPGFSASSNQLVNIRLHMALELILGLLVMMAFMTTLGKVMSIKVIIPVRDAQERVQCGDNEEQLEKAKTTPVTAGSGGSLLFELLSIRHGVRIGCVGLISRRR